MGRRHTGSAVIIGVGFLAGLPSATAQEWLRWNEKPLADQRDPGKVATPPPVQRRVSVPPSSVPLKTLAGAVKSRPGPARADDAPDRSSRSAFPQIQLATDAGRRMPVAPGNASATVVTPSLGVQDVVVSTPQPRATRPVAPTPMTISRPEPIPLDITRSFQASIPVDVVPPHVRPPQVRASLPVERSAQPVAAAVRIAAMDRVETPVPAPSLSVQPVMAVDRQQQTVAAVVRIDPAAPAPPIPRIAAPSLPAPAPQPAPPEVSAVLREAHRAKATIVEAKAAPMPEATPEAMAEAMPSTPCVTTGRALKWSSSASGIVYVLSDEAGERERCGDGADRQVLEAVDAMPQADGSASAEPDRTERAKTPDLRQGR